MPSMKLVVTAMVAAVASISGRCLDIRDMSLTRPSHESNKSIFGEVANLSPNSGAGAPSELRTGFFDDDYASEEDWKRYTSKGHTLMCALASNDENAGKIIGDTRNPPSAASEFQGTLEQEMKDYYWHDTNPSTYSCKLDTHWKMSYAMQSLGLNGKPVSENGDIQGYRTEHWDPDKEDDNGNRIPAINQWYKVGNKELRATKAHYEFGINRKGGAIFNFFLESPKSSASSVWYGGKRDPEPDLLPRLRALSDVLWGFWSRGNPNVKNIRYFFMIGISNEQTHQLIASSLKNTKQKWGEWPGAKFKADSDEGKALLGSPNGAAFAYFLFQRKKELGPKIITDVTVFGPEDEDLDFADPSFVFHVKDAPDPGDGTPEGCCA